MPPIDTSRPCGALADTELADAIRANLLRTLYSRFGDRITEMASRSLGDAPLTAHDAEDILNAAATLSEARNAAFTSAGLKLTDFTWAERDRPRAPDSQHGALLAFCAEVVRESAADFYDIREAAGQLHDRVRAYLEKRGHWPILAASEFEVRAKPAARMLAVWNACDAS
jgi:hypothetical protein